MSARATPTTWKPPRLIAHPYYRHGFTILAIVYLIWSVGTTAMLAISREIIIIGNT